MSNRRVKPPLLVIVVAGLAVAFLAVPIIGLLTEASWGSVWHDLRTPVAVQAMELSLVCSVSATALAIILGMPLAWVLARTELPGRRSVRTLATLPMVMPPVVAGVALLGAFGRRGLLGQPLFDAFGIQFTYRTAGVIVAEAFVAMPFLVLTVDAALRSLDGRYEDAAATLGAGRWTTFRRVTLPLIGPSVVAGVALTWARALGEFGATLTFAGNIQGRTQTMPLAIELALQDDPSVAVALSLALLAVSVLVLVVLRGRWLGALGSVRS